MTETNATTWPPGRYGRRRDPHRWGTRRQRVAVAVAAGLVVAVIGTAVAISLGDQYGPGRPYDATVERFYDVTDAQVVVEFSVFVPAGETAICAVRARARDGGEVGRAEVPVDPAAAGTRARVVHRLPTSERPITGEVQRCWPGG